MLGLGGGNIRIFSFRGVPVEISLFGLIFLALIVLPSVTRFGATVSIGVFVGLLVSILIHEMAHAIVGMLVGAQVGGIQLGFLGGATYFTKKPPSYLRDIATSLAGPLANFALWGIGRLVLENYTRNGLSANNFDTYAIIFLLTYWNFFLGVFNALPAYPLDGGQAMYNLVVWITRREKIAAGIITVTGVLIVADILFGVTNFFGQYFGGGIFMWFIAIIIVVNSFQLFNSATQVVTPRPTPRQVAEKQAEEAARKAKTRKGYSAFEQGRNALLSKDYRTAAESFNQALTLEPSEEDYLDYRAYTYAQIPEYDLALADYSQLIAKYPDRADYYTARAEIYKNTYQLEKARADVNAALALNAVNAQANKLKYELDRLDAQNKPPIAMG